MLKCKKANLNPDLSVGRQEAQSSLEEHSRGLYRLINLELELGRHDPQILTTTTTTKRIAFNVLFFFMIFHERDCLLAFLLCTCSMLVNILLTLSLSIFN